MTVNGPSQVTTNQAITYAVLATNMGASTATGISLRAQLPPGLSGVTPANGGVYNASTGQVAWPPIASIAKGSSVAYTVRLNSGAATGTISAVGSASATTADGDPVATNNDGSNTSARLLTQVVPTTATLLCAAPGRDGGVTLNGTSAVNTYFPGLGTVAAGATSLTVGRPSGVEPPRPLQPATCWCSCRCRAPT